jgi:hypothetical protein
MEPSLRRRLVLEVELIEDAFPKFAHHGAGVQGRERGAEWREQALQERQIVPDRSGEAGPQHLDRHRS